MKLSLLIGHAILAWTAQCQSSSISSLFYSTNSCLSGLCTYHGLGYVESQLHCATFCSLCPTCVGYKYSTSSSDCWELLGDCFLQSSCNSTGFLLAKRRLECLNGGVWDKTKQACNCVDGWVGSTCERRGSSCRDLYNNGYQAGGYNVYLDVYQNGSKIAATYCEIDDTVRTFILRSQGNGGFNKTYQEYIDGFSYGNNMIWLGLENLFAFNKMGHDLFAISLVIDSPDDVYSWWHRYKGFQLGDANQGYAILNSGLHIPGGDASVYNDYVMGDILGLSQGTEFSAWDHDKDIHGLVNCAAVSETGWWFSNCTSLNVNSSVNPLGRNPKNTTEAGHINSLWVPGVDFSDASIYKYFYLIQMYFITYP